MFEINRDKMIQEKRDFIRRIKLVLKADPRSGVDKLEYYDVPEGEFVVITFNSGARKGINVSHNSNGANFKEIGKAVYGDGAIGEFSLDAVE